MSTADDPNIQTLLKILVGDPKSISKYAHTWPERICAALFHKKPFVTIDEFPEEFLELFVFLKIFTDDKVK